MEIEGKRVLVSGASRGLGKALVAAFVAAGAGEVFAGTRTDDARNSLRQEFPERVTPIQLDVTSDPDVDAVTQLGPINILVNNAGVAGFGNPLTMSFDDVQHELAVNYLGMLRLTRAVAPGMITQRDGVIVNIATAFAKVNLPLVGTYCATKAALLSLGQALRAYLSDDNVRVITVMPTTIDTDMSRGANVPKMTKEYVAAEILAAIREERHDPPIGDEAKGVFDGLMKDPLGFEQALMNYK
ncbi:MAG: SDR family NAD(P)-dependent oxidoreductase [Acidobacteria bacterium]|nr:SDR family NAD(P)-dependent oxidoreductase [Acidobacteriota bacterium]MCA1627478.1 SDR family NAD(P)-dependent oxidoreductase [Acidobacteriota bacterium]